MPAFGGFFPLPSCMHPFQEGLSSVCIHYIHSICQRIPVPKPCSAHVAHWTLFPDAWSMTHEHANPCAQRPLCLQSSRHHANSHEGERFHRRPLATVCEVFSAVWALRIRLAEDLSRVGVAVPGQRRGLIEDPNLHRSMMRIQANPQTPSCLSNVLCVRV
jgi:hypothetical protein